MGCGSETSFLFGVNAMRIVETGAAGIFAIAAQILVVATVLI
jgi:hypothetical protein